MDDLPRPDWSWLQRLPVQAIHRQYVAPRAFDLPTYPGSVVRGALGAMLHEQACLEHLTGAGRACRPGRKCAWGSLFESAAGGKGPLAGQAQVPHPMALRVLLPAPNLLDVQLVLMGSGRNHVAVAGSCLDAAALKGLGRGRVPALPVAAGPSPGEAAPGSCPSMARARLTWLTPLRLVSNGRALAASEVTAATLLGGLLRRASLLIQYHGEPGPEPDMAVLSQWVRRSRLESASLRFEDGERYSARQQRAVPLGGLMGSVELDAASSNAFWPLLELGTRIQLGKGTVQGLGCYQLETAEVTTGR